MFKTIVLSSLLLAIVLITTSYAYLHTGTVGETVEVTQPKVNYTPETQTINLNKKKITKLKVDPNHLVLLLGEVDSSSITVANKINSLSNSSEPTVLLINSPGGSVLDGALIVSAIEASKAPVYAVCLQLCASMAAIIESYAQKRLMVDRAILMFHQAAGGFSGPLGNVSSRFKTLDRYVKKMDAKIAYRAGLSLDQFLSLQVSEMWLDAEDAVESKFADGIVSLDLSQLNATSNIDASQKASAELIADKINFNLGDE